MGGRVGTIIAAGSLIAGVGALALGTGGLPFLIGVGPGQGFLANLTFGQISTGLSIAGTLSSGIQAAGAASAEAKATRLEAEARVTELRFQTEAEKTQIAIDLLNRERRLRRTLATQTAIAAGGAADPFSGSPIKIQEATISEAQRGAAQETLVSSLRINQLKLQESQILQFGTSSALSIRIRSRGSLIRTGTTLVRQIGTLKGFI